MKPLLLAVSVAGLFLLSGCEDEHHEHHGGAYGGGSYEGWDRGYGHDYDDHRGDWRYQNNTSPYQGYPDHNGYPNHY